MSIELRGDDYHRCNDDNTYQLRRLLEEREAQKTCKNKILSYAPAVISFMFSVVVAYALGVTATKSQLADIQSQLNQLQISMSSMKTDVPMLQASLSVLQQQANSITISMTSVTNAAGLLANSSAAYTQLQTEYQTTRQDLLQTQAAAQLQLHQLTSSPTVTTVQSLVNSVNLIMNGSNVIPPDVTIFYSGSGVYNLPTSPRPPLYLQVTMIGGGGGGSSCGAAGCSGNLAGGTVHWGEPGKATTFGPLTAGGGFGGTWHMISYGGTSIIPSDKSFEGVALPGGQGGAPSGFNPTTAVFSVGGHGGESAFGGGAMGSWESFGSEAFDNTGGGGGGCGTGYAVCQLGGSGGGAGGFVDVKITSPQSSYIYTVGAGGPGGVNPDVPTYYGGAGGSGFIKVTAHFQ